MPASHVFTIPPGVPFLETLCGALLAGRLVGAFGQDPFALASATIYLPTRRAARALAAMLSQRLGGAALLPRMVPLGEADETEFDLAANPLLESALHVLHPPMPPLERRLILARLVQKWAETVDRRLLPLADEVPFLVPSSPADAIGLAGDLERLMDALTVEGLPWAEIGAAVEAEHSRYFGLTLDFLRIAAESWPGILAERGLSDPAARARLLVLAEAERLTRERPGDPVIVAGSTGSVPATARLLGRRCLNRDRADVVVLGEPEPVAAAARQWVLSQSLRPAETTDAWSRIESSRRTEMARLGLDGISVAETLDEREEALVIALALRETLERSGATAALVTPDRGLALRVSADLARWGIVAEDSAGASLARASAGRFARLAAELAAEVTPARLLALLAHPLVRLGRTRREIVRGAAALEIGVLRGPAPRLPGLAGIGRAVQDARAATGRMPRARLRLKPIDWDLAADIVGRLRIAFEGFDCGADDGICNLVAVAACHRAACDRLLAGPDDEEDDATGLEDASLDGLDALFDDLDFAAAEALPGRFGDYPAFFTALTRERTLAQAPRRAHPRLRILGLLEARLLAVDRVVLGGLDEGVWPVRTSTDSFLNRPMRERIGLPPPERRIGQSAHDFVQALGCRDAVVTRAIKRDGSPTVPSRFLQRLRAFVGEEIWQERIGAGQRLRRYAAALDRGRELLRTPRLARPAPKPDPALFPRRLSVTEIETLVRDPYAIFARHVLGLEALDRVARIPGPADRGSIVHGVIADFAKIYPGAIPDPARAAERLQNLAANAFAVIENDYPELYAEWFPRFQRMAASFLDWELTQRPDLRTVHQELSGRWIIPLGNETFTLTGRADRIEARRDGGFRIVDFKTGAPPSNRMVFAGFSPQLTLEAAMLMAGAFEGIRAASVPDLLYVHASGGRDPFKPVPVKAPPGDARTLEGIVEEHVARLRGLIARFLTGEAAYVSRPYPQYASAYGDYDHLARVLEWSLAGEDA